MAGTRRTTMVGCAGALACAGLLALGALSGSGSGTNAARPVGGPARAIVPVTGAPPLHADHRRIKRARLVARGVTPPLRSLVRRSPGFVLARPAVSAEREASIAPARGINRDGALQLNARGTAPALVRSFEGLSNADNAAADNGYVYIPPDSVGDVGPNDYVEAVNTSFAVFTKSGARLLPRLSLRRLWRGLTGSLCQTKNDGDPVVLYDPLSDRWLISQFAHNSLGNISHECIAVSRTGSPLGSFWTYDFLVSTTKFADYPKIGVWSDAYYLTFNNYTATGNAGVSVLALPRARLAAGLATKGVQVDLGQSSGVFGLLPADVDGQEPPVDEPETLVQLQPTELNWEHSSLGVFEFRPDFVTGTASFRKVASLPTASFRGSLCRFSVRCLKQRGSRNRVDAMSGRLMQRLAYRNFGTSEALVAVHTVDANGIGRAAVRWYELARTWPGSWRISQQGTYAPGKVNRWDASGALDKNGNLALGYSAGSAKVYPGLRVAGRLATDPPGVLGLERVMKPGKGAQLPGFFRGEFQHRWGDYTAMSVDPSDECTFWYVGQYYAKSSNFNWRTRIGSFRMPGCQ